MIRTIRLLTILAVMTALTGCSSPEYIISTTNGVMITVDGKPKLDEETGVYSYKDQEGREATINKDEVSQILER